MTSEQFRSDSVRLLEARKLIDSDIFREMDAIVDAESPHRTTRKIGADAAGIELGFILGFEKRRTQFLELAEALPKKPEEIDPTYTDSTHQQEEQNHAGSS